MKQHPTFTNYLITTDGKVINKKTGRALNPRDNGNGYLIVGLYKNKNRYFRGVNRLVLQTYNPIENSHLYDAHHENEVRDDNRLENLEWELKWEHNSKHHKGSKRSEESKRKMSEAHKGVKKSDETRRRMSEAKKIAGLKTPGATGMKWWNNGVKNIRSKECPGDGWVRGRFRDYNQDPLH